MSNQLNILMIGWEFPPAINGGLGVACHDLCMALSQYARVTMIVPKSSPDFVIQQGELIGVNNVDVGKLMETPYKEELKSFADIYEVEADLNPYYHASSPSADSESTQSQTKGIHSTRKKNKKTISDDKIKSFQIEDLYGGNVLEKVHIFSDIVTRIALKKKFDVIHAHDWMTMLAGMEIKCLTGKPLVVHIHSLEIDRGGPDSRNWVFETEKRGMEYADLIMPVSDFTGDIIKRYYGINEKKIFTVHNGIRPVQPYRSEKPFREKMVLYVGRLTRQKGPEMMIDIAARVLERNPDVRFVMAGIGDSFRSLIEKSAFKHIGSRFHLTGFMTLTQTHQLYSMADVYVMPSVSEPFGLSALEAALFNVPCLISKQSGVAEVLNGSLKFDFWDTNRAADYVLTLLEDETLRDNLIRDAKHDLESISWDLTAKRVLDGYARLGLPVSYHKNENKQQSSLRLDLPVTINRSVKQTNKGRTKPKVSTIHRKP